MSTREGHSSTIRVEVGLGHGLEVDPGHSLEVDPGHSLEVDLGLVLEVGPEIGQEPEVKAVTALTPRMNVPAPRTTTGNP